jgi:hypothetical protein
VSDPFDDDTSRDESDAACVLCGELVGPTHWSRIYARTVLCHDCERGLVRDVVPLAVPAAKKVRLTL